MSKYHLKEYLDKVALANSWSIIDEIKANKENYERLLSLLSKGVTSYYSDSFSHGKIVAFLFIVMSDPELTDKLITAIQNYDNKEVLGVLDG